MKRASFKNSFRALLSLCTAILLLISMIPVTSMAEGEYYTATLETLSTPSNISGATRKLVTDRDEELTPMLPSDWATYTWTDLTAWQADSYQCTFNIGAATAYSTDKALLFYVKTPTDTVNEIGIRMTGPATINPTKISILDTRDDSNTWSSVTGTKWSSNTVGGGKLKNMVYFGVPDGFEGWVRIQSPSNYSSGLKTVRLQFPSVDETYIGKSVSVGAISIVDNAASDLYMIKGPNVTEAVSLFPEKLDYYKAQLATSTGFGANTTVPNEVSFEHFYASTELTPTFASQWARWTWNSDGIENHKATNQIRLVLSDTHSLDSGEALLFYVKLPQNAPKTIMGFRFSDESAPSTYVTLNVGSPVYFMPKSTQEWEASEVISDSANSYPDIEFSAGFEGWVRIPYNSINFGETGWTSLDFYHFRMFLKSIDSSFMDGISIGGFSIVENGAADSDAILINDNSVAVPLFPRSYEQEVENSVLITDKTFETLPADEAILYNNPDRGFRSEEIWKLTEDQVDAEGTVTEEGGVNRIKALTDKELQDTIALELAKNTRDEVPTVSRVYFKMQAFAEQEFISDDAIACMTKILNAYKALGVRAYVTIYYTSDGSEIEETGKINEAAPTYEYLLNHIAQYKTVFSGEAKDAIAAVCMGLYGEDGEWEDYKISTNPGKLTEAQKPDVFAAMAKAVLDNGLFLTVRNPALLASYGTSLTADEKARIGYDEAGLCTNSDITTAGFTASDAYNDAETFVTKWYNGDNTSGTPYLYSNVVSDFAIDRLSTLKAATLSAYHGNADFGTTYSYEDTIFYYWKNTFDKIDADYLDGKGLPYTATWFKDDEGNDVTRTVYDYLRDYLGYRLSMNSLTVAGGTTTGKSISVSAVLDNYGFAAPVTMTESGFAILDENGNVISSVPAGTPSAWAGTGNTVSANMTLPSNAGTYRLAFYVKNSAGQTVRLDNTTPYENGYQILHTFKVEPSDYYTATEVELGTAANQTTEITVDANGTKETVNFAQLEKMTEQSELTPLVPADWFKVTWTEEELGYFNNNGKLQVNLSINGTATASDALMFYVKLPSEAPDSMIAFRVRTTAKINYYLPLGATAYVLSNKQQAWEEVATVEGRNTSNIGGYIPLSAGFEGWVRIPLANVKVNGKADGAVIPDGEQTINTLGMFINEAESKDNKLGTSFVNEGVSVGGMHVVKEATSNLTKLSSDDGITVRLLHSVYNATLLTTTGTPGLTNPTDGYMTLVANTDKGFAPTDYAGSYRYHLSSETETDIGTVNEGITTKHSAYKVSNNNAITVYNDDSLMMYVSTDATADTSFVVRLNSSFTSCIDNDGGHSGKPYYLLNDDGEGNWTKYMTTAYHDTSSTYYYGDITLPAGFCGWLRIPVSSFGTSHGRVAITDNGLAASYITIYPRSLGGQYGSLTFGSFMVMQDEMANTNSYQLTFTDADQTEQTFNFSDKIIRTPDGVEIDQFYFKGDETNVAVTLTDGIGAFNGHKLYYQYTPKGATKPLKMALQRVSAGTHDDPSNVTQFVIPCLSGTDGKIVAGDVAEDVTVLGTSAWYDEGDGVKTYTYNNDAGVESFKIRFMCRAARETVKDGVTYKLSTMRVKITDPNTNKSAEYYIQSTLADLCTDYADFTKVLNGPVATKGNIAYQVQAIATYATEEGKSTSVESELFNSLSWNELPQPQ